MWILYEIFIFKYSFRFQSVKEKHAGSGSTNQKYNVYKVISI